MLTYISIFVFILLINFLVYFLSLNFSLRIFGIEKINNCKVLKISTAVFFFVLLDYVFLFLIYNKGLLSHSVGDIINTASFLLTVFVFLYLFRKNFPEERPFNFLKVYILSGFLLVVFFLVFSVFCRNFVSELIVIGNDSMSPTIKINEKVVVKKFLNNYDRGSVVVFKNPEDKDWYLISRVIGLPGEKIQIKNGKVFIFNDSVPKGFEVEEGYLKGDVFTKNLDEEIVQLDEDEYYLINDNREILVTDSRILYPVKEGLLVGEYWDSFYSYPKTN